MVGAGDAWVLSPDEFRILWESQPVRGAYPAGFSFGPRGEFADADAARHAEKAVEQRLVDARTPMKSRAMDSLCRPRFSIGVTGSAPGPDGRPRPLQIHSGWRSGDEFAFVATQRPGDAAGARATDSDVAVAITGHPRPEWTSALVAALPACPGTGRRLTNDTDVVTTVERLFERPVRVVSPSVSRTSAAAAFVHMRPVMGAVFTVTVGSLADGRTPTSVDVHVTDIPDDGRYALILDRPTVAAGVDDTALARVLNNVINGLRDRHDARINEQ